MASIIILTTLLHPLDFQQLIRRGEVLNPSHQQYMYRLSQALLLHHQVTVLCLPPRLKMSKKIHIRPSIHRQKQGLFYQLPFLNLRFIRPLTLRWHARKYLRKFLKQTEGPTQMLIDGNSALAGWIAKPFRHHAKVISIGVLTDDPYQLSGNQSYRSRQHIALHRHYQLYLALTNPLLKVYQVENKPHLLVPGLIEFPEGASRHPRPYLFFSGALYTRYGIESLIQGFLDLGKIDFDLLIAGYGPETAFVEKMSLTHRHIKFLGLLSPKETMKYQAGAYANINPRPLDETLDQVAIPSKVLDYLSTGVPTISTEHPFIKATFGDTLHWIETSSPDGIRVAILSFLKGDYALAQEKALKAQKIAQGLFGIERVAHALNDWINAIK
jgi:glycosyltransferase involved in cell wall biosynthesis